MPSTRSIRERDEPLPSLLAQWRTPAASRATATRSASYNLALSSSASPQVARATTHALPRPTTSAHTTRRPPAAASSSSPAATATTTTDSGTDSDSSASSLEGLAKRLSTARQAKSDSHRRGSTATAAAAPPGRRPRRQDADANDDDEWEEPEDENNDGFQEDEETATALKRSTEAMAADLDDDRWSAFRTRRNRQSGASSPAPSSTRSQPSRPDSAPRPPVDRAPADFDTGPTSVPSGAHTALDDSARGDDGEEGEHTSNDEDDEDDDDREGEADTSAAYVVSHAEGHPDPRDLLRAQLARPAPSRSTSRPSLRTARTDSLSLGQAASSRPTRRVEEADATLVANDSEEALLYLPRRYFILSTAGKLVYTSDPNEEAATGLVGVMQAIVSIFADEGDKIRYIDAGQTRISFLLKAPLYLVVVSSRGEPEPVLRQHLEYLYLQVLSVVTLAQLQSIFAKRSNFDLRQLIAGTEPFFDSVTSSLQTSFAILLSSISVYRLAPPLRAQLARALDPGKEAIRDLDLLYVLLLAKGRLVTLLRPKKHSIHPTDLHLLLSTIYAPRRRSSSEEKEVDNDAQLGPDSESNATRADQRRPRRVRPSPLMEPGAEAWLPICLPRFNPRGFLHAYVSFLETGSSASRRTGGDADAGAAARFPRDEDAGGDGGDGGGGGGIGLVILSPRRDAFAGVQSAAHAIKQRLLSSPTSSTPSSATPMNPIPGTLAAAAGAGAATAADGGLVHSISMARAHQAYSLGEVAVPGLRHFVYKDRERVQVTMPRWEGEYDIAEHGDEAERARMRLMTLYQRLHYSLHSSSSSSSSSSSGSSNAQTRGNRDAAGSASSSSSSSSPSVQYLRTSREAVLGWVTGDFELYVSTSPLLPHAAVVSCARSVSKWVKQDAARLFLSGKGAGVF
ncbi:hypothetical protein BMF94_3926 [Rhodotorula taiwanensis]|uniref:Vacuolar fusion protein MON1 n=1 Tax=Rhodotorula taiwanensis TaxID=741276 RepID=A0A2S5B8J0_9BASI|nr:hypothetical protein BMF94_3926 [Rhodotorula taiwanensis]